MTNPMCSKTVPAPLASIKGSKLVEVTQDGSWWFRFDPAFSLSVECLWRLTGANHIVVTSVDDGQRFGHRGPVDAAGVVKRTVGDSVVIDVELRGAATDLLIAFANGAALEILSNSTGYENWHFFAGDGAEGRVLGGGKLQA